MTAEASPNGRDNDPFDLDHKTHPGSCTHMMACIHARTHAYGGITFVSLAFHAHRDRGPTRKRYEEQEERERQRRELRF